MLNQPIIIERHQNYNSYEAMSKNKININNNSHDFQTGWWKKNANEEKEGYDA